MKPQTKSTSTKCIGVLQHSRTAHLPYRRPAVRTACQFTTHTSIGLVLVQHSSGLAWVWRQYRHIWWLLLGVDREESETERFRCRHLRAGSLATFSESKVIEIFYIRHHFHIEWSFKNTDDDDFGRGWNKSDCGAACLTGGSGLFGALWPNSNGL